MGKLNKIVKNVLNEAAGISFEVRAWAKIIEAHVDNVIKQEKDKLNASKASTTEPKSQDDEVFGGEGYGVETTEEDDDIWDSGYSHFVFTDGSEKDVDIAFIYGDELWINADVMEEFPGIEKEVKGKLFKVDLESDGSFSVMPTAGSTITSYDFLPGIEEMIVDRMVKGDEFYTDSYDLVKAVPHDNFDDYDYGMYNEDSANRGGNKWLGGWNSWFEQQPKVDLVEIDGKEYPEAYEKFKVDKWVITNSNRIEYDHWKSGYDDDNNYVVYLNMPMGSIGGTMLVHEIKHAYDDWNRMSSGAPAIRDGWEIQNIYTKDFEKLVLGGGAKYTMLKPIISHYYLGSKLESPAYLENEYDSNFMGYRDTAKKLMKFKAANYLNKNGEPAKGLQEMWVDMLINYDIPFFRKFQKVTEFLAYTEKYFNRRGREILKRIDKMRYVHNKPMHKPTPKVFPKPQSNYKPQSTPKTLDVGSKEINKIYDEIDKIEAEMDGYHAKGYEQNKKIIDALEQYLTHLYNKVDVEDKSTTTNNNGGNHPN